MAAAIEMNSMRRGRVVRILDFGAEGRRFVYHSGRDLKTLTVHQAVNGYLTIVWERFKATKREDWSSPFTCRSPRHDGTLTAHCPTRWDTNSPLPIRPLGYETDPFIFSFLSIGNTGLVKR